MEPSHNLDTLAFVASSEGHSSERQVARRKLMGSGMNPHDMFGPRVKAMEDNCMVITPNPSITQCQLPTRNDPMKPRRASLPSSSGVQPTFEQSAHEQPSAWKQPEYLGIGRMELGQDKLGP